MTKSQIHLELAKNVVFLRNYDLKIISLDEKFGNYCNFIMFRVSFYAQEIKGIWAGTFETRRRFGGNAFEYHGQSNFSPTPKLL